MSEDHQGAGVEGVSEWEHGGEEVTGGLLKARYYLLTLP